MEAYQAASIRDMDSYDVVIMGGALSSNNRT
jgi:hypothetical protein